MTTRGSLADMNDVVERAVKALEAEAEAREEKKNGWKNILIYCGGFIAFIICWSRCPQVEATILIVLAGVIGYSIGRHFERDGRISELREIANQMRMAAEPETNSRTGARKWFYRKGLKIEGPVSDSEIRCLMKTGDVLPSDQVWRNVDEGWIVASELGVALLEP